jgi:hypothetical protein
MHHIATVTAPTACIKLTFVSFKLKLAISVLDIGQLADKVIGRIGS